VVVVPFAAASVSLLSGGVTVHTGTGGSTSADRTTGDTATPPTCSARAGVGTPLASAASAGVFSSVVVGGDAEVEVETESFGSGGSGRDCKFDCLQRGQTQFLDKATRRLRSLDGVSSDPMPIAAWPFRGNKPWRPIMAVRTPQAGCHNSS